ncbi:MAG: hypothetical protein AB7D28_00980 [Candidatus Berkiella sp.]
MRNLSINEVANVSGGAVGDVDEYTFALFPNEQMVGVQLTVVGYDKVTWVETGFWTNTIHEEFYPIYDVQPILKSNGFFF